MQSNSQNLSAALRRDHVIAQTNIKKLQEADPQSVKSTKLKPQDTVKSVKSKVVKKKKKKGKKKKKKKAVANSTDVGSNNIADAFSQSPVVANLFLKLMGQEVGAEKSSDQVSKDEERTIKSNPFQRQVAMAEESSESEEYSSESDGSEELVVKASLTPSHTIQEKVSILIGGDPIIVALPKYNLTEGTSRIFRQQNGKSAPEFANLTDRGIFIQTDELKDRGRYFLELATAVVYSGQQLTDTQYFTLVVCDSTQQSQSSASPINQSFNKENRTKENTLEINKANGYIQQKNKETFQEHGEDNIWDHKFQSEHTSFQQMNSQRNKFETQTAKLDTKSELKQELSQSKILKSPNSPQRRKSRSNSESEARTAQHTQQVAVNQFQIRLDQQEHFKTQKTEEDSSKVSRQQTPPETNILQQNMTLTKKERQSILRLPTRNTSGGMLKEINMANSQGLIQETEDLDEESQWDEEESEQENDKSQYTHLEQSNIGGHPQTQKHEGRSTQVQIQEDKSFSQVVAPFENIKQVHTTKNYQTRKSVVVTNHTEFSQHLEQFQREFETKNVKHTSPNKTRSPASIHNSHRKSHTDKEESPSEVRNIKITNYQPSLSASSVPQYKFEKSDQIKTENDKFISFSAKQNKNFHYNPSPKREVSTQELSHQEKIKQRTERVRDSNKVVPQKKQHSNQLVPLQEQRENRRRSRGERANQNLGSASPINLTALNNRYFQEGPKFTEFGFDNKQSLEGVKDYQNESESQLQQSLQSTQQYDVLMATLNSIQSESLKQSFQYAAELGHTEPVKSKNLIKNQHQSPPDYSKRNQGKTINHLETSHNQLDNDSSDLNSASTHNAESMAQAGSYNGKASLNLLIEYNLRKAEKRNQKIRDKIQKVKKQMDVQSGVLPEEFTRTRMDETMGFFDLLHEKEENEINRQLRLQIEAAQDNVRSMQSSLQKQEHERFYIIQATQLKAQKSLADEELLLKSYLYDAISQTQNLKLKCNFLSNEKRNLQDKVDSLLEVINQTEASIAENETNMFIIDQEFELATQKLSQNQATLKPIMSEIESLTNLNEALMSQVNDFGEQLNRRLDDQSNLFTHCDNINQKQHNLELLIEKNTASIDQMNFECEQMVSEVVRAWGLLQQESVKLQAVKKQMSQEYQEGIAQQLSQQLEQQNQYLNQQRGAQIRAIKQAEIEHQNWLLQMEFQRQKDLIRLGQQQPPRLNQQVPVQTQTQPLMHTPKRTYNKDDKSINASQDRSEHTPEPTRQSKHPDNSIFGSNDDLPDSMRYTTTYRQFANHQKFTGKKEGEEGGEDLITYLQSEAQFTRFGTVWDKQEKAPQRKDLSASRERLVNEGQDMAMLLRPGSVTPQNNFKFGIQKFLTSPVNKKMMSQLPKLRGELFALQQQRQIESRTDRRTKLDAQIAFCENRITEIENKIQI